MFSFKLKIVEKVFQPDSKEEKVVQPTDFLDTLHCHVTVFILFIFSCLVGAHYYGNPIDCITPKEIDNVKGWTDYVLNYCFVRGTYRYYGNHFDSREHIREPTAKDYISYYQWIPLFFVFEMFWFYLPQFFWAGLQNWFYIDLETILTDADAISEKIEEREEKEKKLSEYIFLYFYNRRASKGGVYSISWRYLYTITVSYLLIKVLYLLNVIAQFFLVCHFLDADPLWAFKEMAHHIDAMSNNRSLIPPISGKLDVTQSYYFPTEVRCRFSSSHMNFLKENIENITSWNVSHSKFAISAYEYWFNHLHETQCLIPVNYINGKLFLILYYWYSFLIILTAANIMIYLAKWVLSWNLRGVADCVLKSQSDSLTRSKLRPDVHRFTTFLGSDGGLILQFIRDFTNTSTYYQITCKMWDMYNERRGYRDSRFEPGSYSIGNTYFKSASLASGDAKISRNE